MTTVAIIGAGLAGCEAVAFLARRGVPVRLYEMKPARRTPAHVSEHFAELVCSNSLRSDELTAGPGILKAELRQAGSFLVQVADRCRIPGGAALAVDRERFAAEVTAGVAALPGVELVPGEVTSLDDVPEPLVILASGPLTAEALAQDFSRRVGADTLAFYDAIAPIVEASSVDATRLFFASRWGIGEPDAYWNAPMTREQYQAFVDALTQADQLAPRAFEDEAYFEGCQPVEEIARRGRESLAFGPMKPVGLHAPDGSRPYAVVQLRREDAAGTAWNLVGFQTRLRQGDQRRVFGLIPGLEHAEYLRYGSIHRNTFVCHPRVAGPDLRLNAEPRVRLAGQLTGVEGYIESIASGWLTALATFRELEGAPFNPPPPTTALGGLYRHLTLTIPERFQPSNIHLGLLAPLPPGWRGKKKDKRAALGARAVADFRQWMIVASGVPCSVGAPLAGALRPTGLSPDHD
jgi:methylenetetrahydrofolate--tRNA-(uracil-5-)-methyltransferase